MKRLKKILAADEHGPANWLWVLAILLGGAGARLWLIHTFGTPLPFWDQWEDTRTTFVPYFEGRLSWAALFSPHNEHRIPLSRLYNLALLLWNGQWDNQVQMVANVFVYVTGMAGFGWLLARTLGRQFWPLITTVLLLALGLPFTWENTLAGFHSQVYFVILATLLTAWWLGFFTPKNARWWCGAVMAFVSLLTMGSGLIGSATVIGLIGLRGLRNPSLLKQQWPSLFVAVVAVGCGLAMKVEVPYHQVLKAHSLGDFFISLGKYLAWPWIVLPPFALFNILPLLLLARTYLRDRKSEMRREEIVFAVGLWAGIQALASAYARGAGGAHPQWRYMDATCFIMIANALALAVLATRHLEQLPFRRFFRWGAALWALACVSGLLALSARAWTVDIPQRAMYHRFQLKTARAYIASGDAKYLQVDDKAKLSRFAAPNEPQDHAKAMMDMLAPPQVGAILPACVRAPMAMLTDKNGGFFKFDGMPTNDISPGITFAQKEVTDEIGCWVSADTMYGLHNSFESLPLKKPKLPFLEFRVTGHLGLPDLSLSIIDLSNGKRTEIKPSQPPLNIWQAYQIPSPQGDFKVVASDENFGGWFAFQAPRELGRLSLGADRIAGLGVFLVSTGILLSGFLVLSALSQRRRRTAENRPLAFQGSGSAS